MPFNLDSSTERDLDEFVGERLGIIRHLYELTREPDAPALFTYVAQLGDMEAFHFQACGKITTGIGTTRTQARNAAIGEAIERYCGCFYDPESILTASYKELLDRGYAACHPDRFALYSPRQYQNGAVYPPFSTRLRTGWVRGWSLTQEKEMWVPAAFVYLPYQFKSGERQVAAQISTGMACASDIKTALFRAMCEIVEREAVMIAWLQGLPFEALDLEDLDRVCPIYRQRFFEFGYHLRLGRVPHDLGLNTVAALLVDEGCGIVATGSATKSNLQDAALKALLETVQVRELVKSLAQGDEPKFQVEVWQNRADELQQRFAGKSLEGTPNEISMEELLYNCKKRGLQVIAVDLTTQDVARFGLRVVRVVIPEAIPLSRDFQAPCLGGSRIHDVPKKMGVAAREEQELTTDPHPFG